MTRAIWKRAGGALLAILAGVAPLLAHSPVPTPTPTMTWPQLLSRPRPVGAVRIAYGPDPLQVGDLWLPAGRGLKPVVLMIHGGCWQTEIADRPLMDWAAGDLRDHGIAVWNIDYRGVDRPGGGYPGTFQDVADAAGMLRGMSGKYGLDPEHVAIVGHSAGGHLGLWLMGRQRLPGGSALRRSKPIAARAVIGLGALPDLEAARTLPGNDCGVTGVPLVGRPSADRPDVLADTSVPDLLPLGVEQILVTGSRDRIAPTTLADTYAATARVAGDRVRVVEVPGAGHVELIAPGSAAWAVEVGLIRVVLGVVP